MSHLCVTERAKDKSKSPPHSSSVSYITANTLVLLHKTHHIRELKCDQMSSLTKIAKYSEPFCSNLSSKSLFSEQKMCFGPILKKAVVGGFGSAITDWLDKKLHRKLQHPTAVRVSFLSAVYFLPEVHMKETARTVQPTVHYPLLLLHISGDKESTCRALE